MVRDRMLPAGDYRVERADVDPTVLIIKGEHGVHSMVITSSVEAHGKDPAGDSSALVFTREGQQLPSQGRLGRSRRRPGDPEALTFRMIRRGQSPTASRIRGLSPLGSSPGTVPTVRLRDGIITAEADRRIIRAVFDGARPRHSPRQLKTRVPHRGGRHGRGLPRPRPPPGARGCREGAAR
jgi:hypothetical protein